MICHSYLGKGKLMKRVLASGVCSFAVLLANAARADEALRLSTGDPPATVAGALDRQHRDFRPRGSAANRWRYSFHNGHWWYYRDAGRWAYWTGLKWLDYQPNSYRRWYIAQKMADYDAELARFNVLMRPYMSDGFSSGFSSGYVGGGPLILSQPSSDYGLSRPWGGGGMGGGLFYPRAFDGGLNPGTSIGGYMGGILRAPLD